MINVIKLCRHLGNILHIPIRLYDRDHSMVDMGFAIENQADPLQSDPDFCEELLSKRQDDTPVLCHEGKASAYAVIPAKDDQTIIVGPVCYMRDTSADSYTVSMLHNISENSSYSIAYLGLYELADTALLLFGDNSDNDLIREDLFLGSTNVDYSASAGKEANDIIYQHRENQTSHNSYAQEVREQNAVREGNLEALRKSLSEVQTGMIGRLGKDEVTHFRNLAVVNLTLSSRSAMEGGVLPEEAYSLADTYTMKINDLTDPVEIIRLFRAAEIHFTEMVRDIAHSKTNNIYVNRCKQMIHDQLHQHISEEELAKALGITRSYLSQIFLREEGIHLSRYILKEKIRASEHLLMHSDIPLGTIAATFGFSSQSHYGHVFKEIKGISPGRYRKQHNVQKIQPISNEDKPVR